MSKEFLDDYAAKLLEVHKQPGEIICWMNPEHFKFQVDPNQNAQFVLDEDSETKGAVVTRYSRRIYGIGDSE